MTANNKKKIESPPRERRREEYLLAEQIGFVLRLAQQRHTTIFASLMIEGLTPTQWAALAKLHEIGPTSQNSLGRLTAMDGATIKGVIDRLTRRGYTKTKPDPADRRRLFVTLTDRGAALYERAKPIAATITEKTLASLDDRERAELLALLAKLT